MATATATVTITPVGGVTVDSTKALEVVYGTIAISASPATYAQHGLTLNFSQDLIKSGLAPLWVDVQSSPPAGTSPSGYVYLFCPGTTPANGRLAIFQAAGSAAPDVELSDASAIPAGVSGDVITFRAQFQRL